MRNPEHEEALRRAVATAPSPNGHRTEWSARDLLAAEFPPIKWAVDGVLADGLNLIAGSPKVGKSWLALGLAVAVASGGRALGKIPVEQGDALYLALEDPPRRLKRRLEIILAGDRAPAALDLWTDCSRLPDGADELRRWLDVHPEVRLIGIDVWAKLRPRSDPNAGGYESDYLSTYALKAIADEYGVCVIVVHHTRKQASDDWLDTISGTQGLAGGCDGLLVLRRQRGAAAAELLVTGRDVEEATH
ncbi:MAG: AAA family ATPase, partial [Acidimicrobiia bacterium]